MSRKSLLAVTVLCAALSGCASPGVQTQSPVGSEPGSGSGESIAVNDLPRAAVDAVQSEIPGASITRARKQSDGNYYLSDVKVGKKEYTVIVSPDGKILKKADDND
jgi:hypothetical protein